MVIAFQHLGKNEHGDACIAGRRVRVYTIQNRYVMGETPEFIAEQYELPLATILEALAYAADHPAEMEAIRLADAEALQWVIDQMPEAVRESARRGAEEDKADFQRMVEQARRARLGLPVP